MARIVGHRVFFCGLIRAMEIWSTKMSGIERPVLSAICFGVAALWGGWALLTSAPVVAFLKTRRQSNHNKNAGGGGSAQRADPAPSGAVVRASHHPPSDQQIAEAARRLFSEWAYTDASVTTLTELGIREGMRLADNRGDVVPRAVALSCAAEAKVEGQRMMEAEIKKVRSIALNQSNRAEKAEQERDSLRLELQAEHSPSQIPPLPKRFPDFIE